MISASDHAPAAGQPVGTGIPRSPRRARRLRCLLVGLVVLLVAGGAALLWWELFAKGPPATAGIAQNADPTSLATVTRGDLSSQTQVDATLGYAGSYSAINQAPGTITSLPAVGQIVS